MNQSTDAVYDPGLQPERTLLAWRRTCLTVAVVSALAVRFTAASVGWPAIVLGGLGVLFGLLSYLAADLGYRRVHRQLSRTDRHPGNGWPPACLAAAMALLGSVCLVYVVRGA